MPLYKIKLTTTMVVWVDRDDEDDAISMARANINNEFDNDNSGIVAKRVKKLADIPRDWRDSIPWGLGDGITCTCKDLYVNPKPMKRLVCSLCDNSAVVECCKCCRHYCEDCNEDECCCKD